VKDWFFLKQRKLVLQTKYKMEWILIRNTGRGNSFCIDCGKPLSNKNFRCDECRIKHRIAYSEEQKRIRRETRMKENPNYNNKNCIICGIPIENSNHIQKYCLTCRRGVVLEKLKYKNKVIVDSWRNLPEAEKVRRMNIISQKLLYKSNEELEGKFVPEDK